MYEGLCDRYIFQAIAIETSCVFGRDANAFISRLIDFPALAKDLLLAGQIRFSVVRNNPIRQLKRKRRGCCVSRMSCINRRGQDFAAGVDGKRCKLLPYVVKIDIKSHECWFFRAMSKLPNLPATL